MLRLSIKIKKHLKTMKTTKIFNIFIFFYNSRSKQTITLKCFWFANPFQMKLSIQKISYTKTFKLQIK